MFRVCYLKDGDWLVWSEKMDYGDALEHAAEVCRTELIHWVDIVSADGVGEFLKEIAIQG